MVGEARYGKQRDFGVISSSTTAYLCIMIHAATCPILYYSLTPTTENSAKFGACFSNCSYVHQKVLSSTHLFDTTLKQSGDAVVAVA